VFDVIGINYVHFDFLGSVGMKAGDIFKINRGVIITFVHLGKCADSMVLKPPLK